MPGQTCAVASCNNNSVRSKKRKVNTSYHRFPKEEKLCKVWTLRCRRKYSFNQRNSCVCSDHFLQSDFEVNYKSELMGTPLKRMLKKNAVPSVNLTPGIKTAILSEREQFDQEERKNLVEEIWPKTSADKEQFDQREKTNLVEETPQPIAVPYMHTSVPIVMTVTKPDNSQNTVAYIVMPAPEKSLEDKYNDLMAECQSLKRKCKYLEDSKKKLTNDLSSVLDQLNVANTARTSLEKMLKSSFSSAQIDVMLKRRKKVQWTNNDIIKAFTIRHFSKRCYMYLRDNMKYPLPHIDTLDKWARKRCLKGYSNGP